jgi:signal transduction histidine kinase
VRVPPEVVHEVLVELLRNAADALEGRGEVRVMTRLAGETLAIEVRDNGPGIAASDLGRIFERGFTTKAAGTGHGLFLARRLLETYGGAIAAAAAAGSGASFTLTFPLDGMRTTIALGAAEAKR